MRPANEALLHLAGQGGPLTGEQATTLREEACTLLHFATSASRPFRRSLIRDARSLLAPLDATDPEVGAVIDWASRLGAGL